MPYLKESGKKVGLAGHGGKAVREPERASLDGQMSVGLVPTGYHAVSHTSSHTHHLKAGTEGVHGVLPVGGKDILTDHGGKEQLRRMPVLRSWVRI